MILVTPAFLVHGLGPGDGPPTEVRGIGGLQPQSSCCSARTGADESDRKVAVGEDLNDVGAASAPARV